jgi:hypothetical protein
MILLHLAFGFHDVILFNFKAFKIFDVYEFKNVAFIQERTHHNYCKNVGFTFTRESNQHKLKNRMRRKSFVICVKSIWRSPQNVQKNVMYMNLE